MASIEQPTFECNLCDTKFHSAINLMKHKIDIHQTRQVFYCEHCNYKTYYHEVFENHLRYWHNPNNLIE
jgi:hypothetical protein